jgi:hypothetical protein
MTQGPEATPEQSLTTKLVGMLLAFGLTVAGLLGHTLIQELLARRDAAILHTIPDVLVWWREPAAGELWTLLLVALPPLLLIPGAFGVRSRRLTLSPPWRWRMVALAAALVAGGLALEAVVGKPELSLATPFGAAWLHDGKPREHWSWGAATAVGVGCVNAKRDNAREGQHSLNYDVAFPSGREARLIRDTRDLGPLLVRLVEVDQSLRARAIPRFASVDDSCLRHFSQGLKPAEQAALRSLMSR